MGWSIDISSEHRQNDGQAKDGGGEEASKSRFVSVDCMGSWCPGLSSVDIVSVELELNGHVER